MKSILNKTLIVIGLMTLFESVDCSRADSINIPTGFVLDAWLTNAGDLRGVSVGSGQGFAAVPYVYSFSQSAIIRVDSKEMATTFSTGFSSGTGRMVFDLGGQFNGDMFVTGITDGGSGIADRVYRVKPNGVSSVFFQDSQFDQLMKGIAFGTDTAFGPNLFVLDAENDTLQKFYSNSNRASFGSGISSAVWEDDMLITGGGAFGENAFITDSTRDLILRMTPDGTTSQFAVAQGALALALGSGVFGDFLYVGTYQGNVLRVDPSGSVSVFASGFGRQSPEGGIRGIDILDDMMWLTSDRGTLYKISIVPEPGSFVLLIGGCQILLNLRKRFN
jgi:hypothetical protein